MKTLNLYWWDGKANVGDYSSFYLVQKLYHGKINRKDPNIALRTILHQHSLQEIRNIYHLYTFPHQKYISATGSIIDHLRRNVLIWGSGCRSENSQLPPHGKYYLVRG